MVMVLQNITKFVFLQAFSMQTKKFGAFSILTTKYLSISTLSFKRLKNFPIIDGLQEMYSCP